ncbi:MAG: hypothetical protein SGJ18_14010 [Pseudomonadota bacterium]|nr:hypothetical protein [Pseudomonadota bacterium]
MKNLRIFSKWQNYFILIIPVAVFMNFQNCSNDVQFAGSGDNNSNSFISKCAESEVFINDKCVPTAFTECKQLVELETELVPPLNSSGVCYYKKVLNETVSHNSGSFGESRASDIFARDHNNNEHLAPVNPYVLSDVSLNLVFSDSRKVTLTRYNTGSPKLGEREQQLFVDNFILVEIASANRPIVRLARGTGDSEPYVNNNRSVVGDILVNNSAVTDFLAYSPSGSANISAIDISPYFIPNLDTQLRIRNLDCGGLASASDVFLVIH